MNCLRCNTPNEDGAKFCKNCGMDLTYNPTLAQANNIDSQSLMFVLVGLSWEYISGIIWFVIQKLIVPKMYASSQYEEVNKLYKTAGWSIDLLSIVILLVLSIITKNKTARILLIVFTVLRVGFLLGYRVFS